MKRIGLAGAMAMLGAAPAFAQVPAAQAPAGQAPALQTPAAPGQPPAKPAAVPAQAVPAAAAAPTPLVGGPNFISPAGEPFHSTDTLSGAEHWFRRVDTNNDGRIVPAEFRADFAQFFAKLDTDHDGELGPDEIEHYETEVAPEIRVASSYGDPSLAKSDDQGNVTPPPYPTRLGAGRFGYLDMPEPIVSADANMDRAVQRREFEAAADQRFKMLDTNGDGAITRDELPKLGSTRDTSRGGPGSHRGGGGGGGHHRGGRGGGGGGQGGGFGG